MTQAMPAVCEIKLPNGQHCGITAIARCTKCWRAYCTQHQNYYHNVYSLLPPDCQPISFPPDFPQAADCVNRCLPCFEELRAEVAAHPWIKNWMASKAAPDYFSSGAARTALLTNKVPLVALYLVYRGQEVREKKGIFRTRYFTEQVEAVTPISGWILGTFKWQYRIPLYREGYDDITEDRLTALLNLSSDDRKNNFKPNYGLARVQPYSGGYEVLNEESYFKGDWIAIGEVVRRLAGI